MARLTVGIVFGLVVGVVAGAALQIHAANEGGDAGDGVALAAEETPVSVPTPDTAPEPASSVWGRLAVCESTSNWHANTGNGYFGGVQEDLTFWRRYGGLAYAARPDLASRAAQIAVAERGLASQGWSAWPACSRRLGLR